MKLDILKGQIAASKKPSVLEKQKKSLSTDTKSFDTKTGGLNEVELAEV